MEPGAGILQFLDEREGLLAVGAGAGVDEVEVDDGLAVLGVMPHVICRRRHPAPENHQQQNDERDDRGTPREDSIT